MLRLASYDIVFQEIPGEVTLALNISGCPNRCPGCHSPHLQSDAGPPLDDEALSALLADYGGDVTCVCFMGGDGDPAGVARLAALVRGRGNLKTGWYSGRASLPSDLDPGIFDYIKLGPFVQHLGGLRSPTTNQRFHKVESGELTDITFVFQNTP